MRYNTVMYVALFILAIMTLVALVLVSAVAPVRTGVSIYELKRRSEAGNSAAAYELKREISIADLYSLRRLLTAFLLVLFAVLVIGAIGLWWGAFVALGAALLYSKIATIGVIRAISQKIYQENEETLLQRIERHPKLMRVLRSVVWVEQRQVLSSREELEHMVRDSQGILHEQDKRRIVNSLHFDERKVEEVMTSRGALSTIKKDDIVGPYILNDLHQTGHSRFPVIDGDIDHIVGILYTKDLITLGDKVSKSAGDLMDGHVYYINADQTLNHALTAFLKTHRHMFIVVNGYRETAGVVTLEDVIEALLGYKIVDEFDQHDDLRAVAERNARKNNNPPHATNV